MQALLHQTSYQSQAAVGDRLVVGLRNRSCGTGHADASGVDHTQTRRDVPAPCHRPLHRWRGGKRRWTASVSQAARGAKCAKTMHAQIAQLRRHRLRAARLVDTGTAGSTPKLLYRRLLWLRLLGATVDHESSRRLITSSVSGQRPRDEERETWWPQPRPLTPWK